MGFATLCLVAFAAPAFAASSGNNVVLDRSTTSQDWDAGLSSGTLTVKSPWNGSNDDTFITSSANITGNLTTLTLDPESTTDQGYAKLRANHNLTFTGATIINGAALFNDAAAGRIGSAPTAGNLVAMTQGQSGLSAGSAYRNGAAVWAMPLYQHNSVSGLRAGNFKTGYTSNLGGMAVGADYTFNEAFRLGLSVNTGGGSSKSKGDFAHTKNDINFWGLNLYGGYQQGAFTLSADLGYTHTNNKLKQDNPAFMGIGQNNAKVKGQVLSFGLGAAYSIPTSFANITPYASARYNAITTKGYDVKNVGTMLHVEKDTQKLWQFSLGTQISKDIAINETWAFAPKLGLGILLSAGDVNTHSRVRIPGISQTSDLSMQAVDKATFDGRLGFEFKSSNASIGLNYNLQASKHRTGHGLNASFRYAF